MKSFISTLFLCAFIHVGCLAQSFYSQPSTPKRSSSTSYNGYVNPSTSYNSGYQKSNGTYVQPHMKTQQNQTNLDNYSTQGNSNPFTNEKGSRAKDYSVESYNYGSGKVIQTGERGGQYYHNDKGNKVYVPKR